MKMSEKASSPKPKTPKTKKTKKAGSSTKGLYSKLIEEAIQAVGKPVKGASRQAIKQYIEEKHSKTLGKGWPARLNTVLRTLASSKKIVQTKGSFRVGKKDKKASTKKAKKTVKKSTKKATKKPAKKTARKSVKKASKKTKAKSTRKTKAKKAKESAE